MSADAYLHVLTPAEARAIVDDAGSIPDEYKEQLIANMVSYSATLPRADLRPV
jgi:hypothetical protein